jgi:hypothetical protein
MNDESEQTGTPLPLRIASALGDHYLYCIGLRDQIVGVTRDATETSYRLCACSDGRWITRRRTVAGEIHAAVAAQSQQAVCPMGYYLIRCLLCIDSGR